MFGKLKSMLGFGPAKGPESPANAVTVSKKLLHGLGYTLAEAGYNNAPILLGDLETYLAFQETGDAQAAKRLRDIMGNAPYMRSLKTGLQELEGVDARYFEGEAGKAAVMDLAGGFFADAAEGLQGPR